MDRSVVRAVWAIAPACALALGLATGARADGVAAPAPAVATPSDSTSNQELRQEIELLKQRLAELERKLEQKPATGSLQLQDKKEPQGEEKPKGEEKGGKDEEEGPPDTAKSVQTITGSRLTFGGFAQLRITNIGSQNGNRTPNTNFDFQVARFRPRLIYTFDPHWSAEVDINGTTRQDPGSNDAAVASFSPRDMYAQWQNAGIQGRIGQSKIPFGYEVYLEGDPVRVEMERARILTTLYPDERDVG